MGACVDGAERSIAQPAAGLLALVHLAVLAARAGRTDAAVDALARAAALQSGHPVVRRVTADVHEIAGDLDRAIAIVESLCRDPVPTGNDPLRLVHLKWRRRLAPYRALTHPATLQRIERLLPRLPRLPWRRR